MKGSDQKVETLRNLFCLDFSVSEIKYWFCAPCAMRHHSEIQTFENLPEILHFM
jgi:hypothetical protein